MTMIMIFLLVGLACLMRERELASFMVICPMHDFERTGSINVLEGRRLPSTVLVAGSLDEKHCLA